MLLFATAMTAGVAAQTPGSKGSGSYDIDGHNGTFVVQNCMITNTPDGRRTINLIGKGGMGVSVTDEKPGGHNRRSQSATVQAGTKAGATRYHADYELGKEGWRSRGKQSAGPLIELGSSRLVVDGKFGKFAGGKMAGAVHGHIEADCPALSKQSHIRAAATPAATPGKKSGSVRVGGQTFSFKPGMCMLQKFDNGGHMFQLQGSGKDVHVMLNLSVKAGGNASQSVQLGVGSGPTTARWTTSSRRRDGKWQDSHGHEISGPPLVLDGHHISGDGVVPKQGGSTAGQHWHIEAYCPDMLTIGGS